MSQGVAGGVDVGGLVEVTAVLRLQPRRPVSLSTAVFAVPTAAAATPAAPPTAAPALDIPTEAPAERTPPPPSAEPDECPLDADQFGPPAS